MTKLLFTLTAIDDGAMPNFIVRCFPGEDPNRSELAAALLISTTARIVMEQLVLSCGGEEPYQFRDDADTVRIKKRFKKCGISITVDRKKLLKEMKRKK